MAHDHVHDDPRLAEILAGDHFHDTPPEEIRKLVADWFAMLCERLPDGEHVLHLVPLTTDREDDVIHVGIVKRRGRVRKPDNALMNWLHILPLEIGVGDNDVLVSLTTRIPHEGDILEQERMWVFVPPADLVEFTAFEAEEFFEDANMIVAHPDDLTEAEPVTSPEELAAIEAATEQARQDGLTLAHYEDEVSDIRVEVPTDAFFQDAWTLDDFLANEAASGKIAPRFDFIRYVGPLDLYEPPRLQDRPNLRKRRRGSET